MILLVKSAGSSQISGENSLFRNTAKLARELQAASLCHHPFGLSICFCVARKGRYEFENDSCDYLCEFCGIAKKDTLPLPRPDNYTFSAISV
ncbi:hypothetical protein VU01_10182 [Candidatus Electrothrix marina]|uniref:Uncharacterized protein n=1 Tax=Candidatus Electrothrix marina TaxID=1859130 RepID=A0A444JGU5_9BACT|nr:hypothetical protein VU01_10182 [Candidatus Electrothrix marina]